MTLGICPVFLYESADTVLCLREREREIEIQRQRTESHIYPMLHLLTLNEMVFPKLLPESWEHTIV